MNRNWSPRPVLETQVWEEGDWEYVEWCDRTIRIECLLMRDYEVDFQFCIDGGTPLTGYESAQEAIDEAVDKIVGWPDCLGLPQRSN